MREFPMLLIRHMSSIRLTAAAPNENSLSRVLRDVETVLGEESDQCCARGEGHCGGLLGSDTFGQRVTNALICEGVLAVATQPLDLACSNKTLDNK